MHGLSKSALLGSFRLAGSSGGGSEGGRSIRHGHSCFERKDHENNFSGLKPIILQELSPLPIVKLTWPLRSNSSRSNLRSTRSHGCRLSPGWLSGAPAGAVWGSRGNIPALRPTMRREGGGGAAALHLGGDLSPTTTTRTTAPSPLKEDALSHSQCYSRNVCLFYVHQFFLS